MVCESEFKGVDMIPRALIGGGLIIGILGFGSYLQSGKTADPLVARLGQRQVETKASTAPAARSTVDTEIKDPARAVPTPTVEPLRPTQMVSNHGAQPAATEEIYYCGART